MSETLPVKALHEIKKFQDEKVYGDITLHFNEGKILKMSVRRIEKMLTQFLGSAPHSDFKSNICVDYSKEIV